MKIASHTDFFVKSAPATRTITRCGGHCDLNRNGEHLATLYSTPGTVHVDKTKYDIAVTCTKPGYQPASVNLESGYGVGVFGNIILGGAVGWGSIPPQAPTTNIPMRRMCSSFRCEAKRPHKLAPALCARPKIRSWPDCRNKILMPPPGWCATSAPVGRTYYVGVVSEMVPRDRIELPTRGFSIRCSTD